MTNFDNPDLLNEIDANESHLGTATSLAIAGLKVSNDPPTLFISGDAPVRIVRPLDKPPFLEQLDADRMRFELDRRINWTRKYQTKDGDWEVSRVSPRMDIVKNVMASPDLRDLPHVTRVVTAPIYGPDGTLRIIPGYDEATQTYYAPPNDFEAPYVSPDPSMSEVEAARQLLWDTWTGDFPYASVPEHANAIGLAIAPFVREMIDGATPLHLIEKNKPGTGATLLADVITTVMLGSVAESGSAPESDAEWRKHIASKLISSDPFYYIDNVVPGAMDFASVKQVLTVGKFEDRLLGTNQLIKRQVRCIWIATANNLALSQELLRRVVRIRLIARTDHPEERKTVAQGGDIRIPDLHRWTRDNRLLLISAIYTIVNHWVSLGRPAPTVTPIIGSFGDYCTTVGGILESAGIGGFLLNREDVYNMADPFETAFRNLLMNLHDAFGESYISINDMMPYTSDLNLGTSNDQGRRVKLGMLLHTNRATPHGEFRISEPKYIKGYPHYRILYNPPSPEDEQAPDPEPYPDYEP